MATTAPGQDDPLSPSEMDDPGMISGAGTLPLDGLDAWSTYRPRFSLVYDAGKGIGYQNSFASLEAFVPLRHPEPDRLWFADFRGLFDKNGVMGGNLGLGRRQFCPWLNATLGAHVYYDYRKTAANQFQQISPGLDLLTDRWDFRVNGYLPMVFGARKPAPDQFRGHFLYIDRFERALSGVDMELGVPIPLCDRFQPKLLGGLYCFDGSEHGSFWGWRARVEGQLTDAVSLHLSVQDDPLFKTTVNFAVAVRFPGGALMRRRPLAGLVEGMLSYPLRRQPDERLAANVYRLQNVVLDDTEEALARDPATGDPITFLHVAAGGNSDGSFEDPYATLTDALADPRYDNGTIDVVYVRSGFRQSVTHADDITLTEGMHLLSNGPVQMIDTQLGSRVLPFSGNDPGLNGLPTIEGQVSLGDNTTISGFQIEAPAGEAGISGMELTSFNILHNVINFPSTANGILLRQIEGTGTIRGNRLTGGGKATGDGLAFGGIPLADPPMVGNGIVNAEDSDLSGTIDNNTVQRTPGNALQVTDSRFDGDITNNTFSDSLSGILFQSINLFSGNPLQTSFTGNITDNRLINNSNDGLIMAQTKATSTTIARNTIDANNRIGIAFVYSTLEGAIEDNTISGVFSGSLPPDSILSRIFKIEESKLTLDFDDVVPQAGILLLSSNSTADILNNTISKHERAGIEVDLSPFPGDEKFSGNIRGNSVVDSIVGITLTGSIVPVNANIENNVVDDGAAGIVVVNNGGTPFIGNINGNKASGNKRFGINVQAGTFQGNIANNTANGNALDGILVNTYDDPFLPTGIPPDVIATISGNETSNNTGSGISVFSNGGVTSNVANNVANDNEATGISLFALKSLEVDVAGNKANENGHFGISIDAREDFAAGRIANNEAKKNDANGINVFVFSFTGDIVGNRAEENGQSDAFVDSPGIDVAIHNLNSVTTSSTGFTGSIRDNVALGNRGDGIRVKKEFDGTARFIGNVIGNTANDNLQMGIGLGGSQFLEFANLELAEFSGQISDNTANSNKSEGIVLRADSPTAVSDVKMIRNELSGNNISQTGFQQREVGIVNAGDGTFDLELRDNTSLNIVPGGLYNYDLFNTGSGTFNVSPANVNGLNTGSVGSSDGSVVIP